MRRDLAALMLWERGMLSGKCTGSSGHSFQELKTVRSMGPVGCKLKGSQQPGG